MIKEAIIIIIEECVREKHLSEHSLRNKILK